MPISVVFMGTPAFAVPSLRALAQHYSVAGVVTQPDRPAGRGHQVIISPVKQLALQLNLPLLQPKTLREPEALAHLAAWKPELIVVAAFGQILRPAVLDLPPLGCINVHGSLLPRHRGAAPILAAILAGDSEAGITMMRMAPGIDTGPMLAQRATSIAPDDTTATLAERLAFIGAELPTESLPAYLAGTLIAQPQDEALATYAPQLEKEDGRLDFTRPAVELERRVRAVTPWPGAFALWQGQPLKILRAALAEAEGEPGAVVAGEPGPVVCCRPGGLRLLEVQAAGKKPTPAAAFARGARGFVGSTLA
jgi:methionyl-tRNA formyltransferase